MAYDPKAFSKMVGGGGCPDVAPKGNSKRPQNYTGNYVTDIGALKEPGKQHNPAPQQAFRKELPPAKSSDALLDGQYEPGEGLTFEDVYKRWQ